ncbi:uncharacterized protein LOC116340985 [Contarinia nasturtii]|uniref:uncharacterized protein LOC116340985 n=1 Tax=Contarinia nasturtii TaxID=265458 RepID=UPI0012D37B32|nr:uncharacterized protein LOC116340985 [Contarinia nasturtii]
MKLLLCVFLLPFALVNNLAHGSENDKEENKFVVRSLVDDIKKFETDIKSVETILNSLSEGDKRKWQGFISLNLLQENLKEFQTTRTQIAQLNRSYKAYFDAIVQIFIKFKNDNANEIKKRNKADALQKLLNWNMKRFQRDMTTKAMMNVKVHKELESRRNYAAKLAESLKSNFSMKAIAGLGKNDLVIENGLVPQIRNILIGLKENAKKAVQAQNDFAEHLKRILNQP